MPSHQYENEYGRWKRVKAKKERKAAEKLAAKMKGQSIISSFSEVSNDY